MDETVCKNCGMTHTAVTENPCQQQLEIDRLNARQVNFALDALVTNKSHIMGQLTNEVGKKEPDAITVRTLAMQAAFAELLIFQAELLSGEEEDAQIHAVSMISLLGRTLNQHNREKLWKVLQQTANETVAKHNQDMTFPILYKLLAAIGQDNDMRLRNPIDWPQPDTTLVERLLASLKLEDEELDILATGSRSDIASLYSRFNSDVIKDIDKYLEEAFDGRYTDLIFRPT